MALEPLPLPLDDELDMPFHVDAFLREADDRIEAFFETGANAAAPLFVPSDSVAVYAALTHMARLVPRPGCHLCEWGSGFGVVAGLARLCGFQAVGIEREGALVRRARRLLDDFELDVELLQGSFLPAGYRTAQAPCTEDLRLENATSEEPSAWDRTDLCPEDFHVIFAYPWPREAGWVEELFEAVARPGALLLTYHGIEDLRLRHKKA